jgi:hypothetical protein
MSESTLYIAAIIFGVLFIAFIFSIFHVIKQNYIKQNFKKKVESYEPETIVVNNEDFAVVKYYASKSGKSILSNTESENLRTVTHSQSKAS